MRRVFCLAAFVVSLAIAAAWACPPTSSVITCTGTAADTATIQNAFNVLPGTGGVITIGGATRCGIGASGLIFSDKSNVLFQGQGGLTGLQILAAGPTFLGYGPTSVQLSNCTRCQVQDLYIDGGGFVTNLIGVKDSTEVMISHNALTNSGHNGAIVAGNNLRNRYERNTVWGLLNTSRGLWIGNSSAGEYELDPQIVGNRIQITTATGIVTVSRGAEMLGNLLDGTGSTVGSGMALSAGNGLNTMGAVVSGNTIRGWGFHGVQSDAITDTDFSDGISVLNNFIELCNGSGVYVVRTRHWTIQGNTIRNNNADASGSGHGVQIDRGQFITVAGNLIYDSRSGASRTQNNGVYVSAVTSALDTAYISIMGNTIRNHPADGIRLTNGGLGTLKGVAIMGNVSQGNTGWGISVTDTVDGTITEVLAVGNVLLDNGSGSVRMDPTDGIIANNQEN